MSFSQQDVDLFSRLNLNGNLIRIPHFRQQQANILVAQSFDYQSLGLLFNLKKDQMDSMKIT